VNCPKCGVPNEPGTRECQVCGASLPPNCKGCGRKVPEGVEYCVLCRTGRTEEIAEQTSGPVTLEVPGGFLPAGLDFHVPFVGRRDEIERISMLYKSSIEDKFLSFITLTGPPGVGKTRLAVEVVNRLQHDNSDIKVLRGSCGGPGAPPYAAFIQVVADLAGVGRQDRPAVVRNKLVETVTKYVAESRVTEISHLLAEMLSCPFSASSVVEPLFNFPAQLEMRMFLAVRWLFAGVATSHPVVILLDNGQRAGPETVNLLHYLAAGLIDAPVLLLVVGRQDMVRLHSQWGEGDFEHARFDLTALEPDDAEALLKGILSGVEPIPPSLVHNVRHRLDRHPRTIEELIRYLMEVKILDREDDTWVLDEDLLSAIDIPASHEEIVAERLRSLDQAELEVLEKAAVCGETFWLDLVVALYRSSTMEQGSPDGPSLDDIAQSGDRNQASVVDALTRHVTRGFLMERRTTQIRGEREFRFAYPPIWNLVYDRVAPDRRKKLHKLVAQWLELRPEGRVGSHQEEVGRHLELAGELVAAAQRYRRAGDMARASYSNDRAISLYQKALECIGESDVAIRMHVWHDLGSIYELRGQYEDALTAYEKMLRLGWVMASRAKGGVAFNKMGRVWRQKGELVLALDYLTKGKDLFDQAGDERGIAGSLDDIGQVLWMQGKYEEALSQSAAALEKRRKLGNMQSIASSLTNVGNIERDRGLLNEAAACHEEALAIRREINDRAGIVQSLNSLAHLELLRGNSGKARQLWMDALNTAEEIGALPMQALVLAWLGETALDEGQYAEAKQRYEESLKLCRELDERRVMVEALRGMALLAIEDGKLEDAGRLAEEAKEMASRGGLRDAEGRALLALAHVRSKPLFDASGRDAGADARQYYDQAISVFRETGNDAELGRALLESGEFCAERSDTEQARNLLMEAKEIMSRIGMRGWRDAADLLESLDASE